MIAGNLQVTGFGYGTGDGKDPNGNPIKVLGFKDVATQAQFTFVFTPDEFDKFIQTISESSLVIAHKMPTNVIVP